MAITAKSAGHGHTLPYAYSGFPQGSASGFRYISGSVAEFVGQNGAFQQHAGESVRRGDRRSHELGLEGSSPPLACLLLESLAASGGNQWSDAGAFNHTIIH